ncbi:asparagine synthase (glutamine-hydrolyzing), partial [bacterium]|nr:asparagine synthase (glutamine-hydrolyzing) [bacterium]
MCGIHGIISARMGAGEIKEKLTLMGLSQAHRGPDDAACAVYESGLRKVGFGFVRLSILDLETGMQPVGSSVDKAALICNGQLYNYLELKDNFTDVEWQTKGDAEVALQMFRRFLPETALLAFNGMYAGAFFDPGRRKLVLFRDRFGIKPLYYREVDGDLWFASEIKPLLKAGGAAEIRKAAFPTLFTYRYLPGEETIFAGIKRLPPGSFLLYDLDSGGYEIKSYWQNVFPQSLDTSGDRDKISLLEAEERFYEIFTDAVRLRLRSDVEVGSFLSGGIDSCAVAAAAVRSQPELALFTIAFQEKTYNELPAVKDFLAAGSSHFSRAKHHVGFCQRSSLGDLPELLRALEEPIFLGATLPTDQVCRIASKRVKTVLTGEGADEIFAGYRKFLIEMAAHEHLHADGTTQYKLERAYPELKAYLGQRASDPLKRYIQSEMLFSEFELSRLLGYDKVSVPGLSELKAAPTLDGREHPLNAALAVESRCRLPDYVILRLDKLAMRHSLETRTPFLDYRLAEFAARLPVDYKINLQEGREKYILRQAFSRYKLLDEHSAWRRKQPFTSPLAAWL